jgi:hypothetical protein
MIGKDVLGNSEPWSHTHTFGVTDDEVYVKVDAKLMLIGDVTITGKMQWKSSVALPEFSILRRLSDGEVFAATAVMTGSRPEEMFAFTISPNSNTTGVHPIRLTEKQSNAIRRLALRHEGQ